MVRAYLLTAAEEEIIKAFLVNGEKKPNFRVLKMRMLKLIAPTLAPSGWQLKITSQMDLILRFIRKLGGE